MAKSVSNENLLTFGQQFKQQLDTLLADKQNKITISTSEPTSSDGVDGDVWIVI